MYVELNVYLYCSKQRLLMRLILQGSAETLELVVKTPVRDEYLKSIFLPAISSVKENAFYSKIIPAMKQMQSDANVPEPEQIDCFIEYIGSRLSLDESKSILFLYGQTDSEAKQNIFCLLRNRCKSRRPECVARVAKHQMFGF